MRASRFRLRMEMTENIVRMVRNDVAQNLAAAAKSSQKQPDPHRSNAGDKTIGVVLVAGWTQPWL